MIGCLPMTALMRAAGKQSALPREKTLQAFQMDRLPKKIRALPPTLCEGSFLSRAECLLAFGNPGSGKNAPVCGIGHELVQRGHTVLFRRARPSRRIQESRL